MKSNKDIAGKNYHQQAHFKKNPKQGEKKTQKNPNQREFSRQKKMVPRGDRKIKKK